MMIVGVVSRLNKKGIDKGLLFGEYNERETINA